MMDTDSAWDYLASHENKNPSNLGEAVDVLHQTKISYEKISEKVGVSSARLSAWHCVFQLPKGIQWKVDQGDIPIEQARQITKLQKEDQWLLAFFIVDTKSKLTNKECSNVIQAVTKDDAPIKEAINKIGGRFDKSVSLILPFGFDEQLSIAKSAWNKHQKIEDFCLNKIRYGTKVDIEKEVDSLVKIATTLRG